MPRQAKAKAQARAEAIKQSNDVNPQSVGFLPPLRGVREVSRGCGMAEAMPFPKTAPSHNAKAASPRLTAQGGRSRILATRGSGWRALV